MIKSNLENRSEPAIIISSCAHQDINDPTYQELIRYCIENIKKYDQLKAKGTSQFGLS